MAAALSAMLEGSLPSPLASHNNTSLPSSKQIETLMPLDSRVVLFLEMLGATPVTGENHKYKILPGIYKRVLDTLEVENQELWQFVSSDLCYEIHDDEQIIFKMSPSRLHGLVCSLLSDEIIAGYKSILDDPNLKPTQGTRTLINNIVQLSTSDVQVEIDGKASILVPDNHWGLVNTDPAGLILEVAVTQPFNDIRQKVEKYLIGSKFQTRMVIAVHVKEDFGIGISVWKGATTKVVGKEGQYWFIQTIKEREQIEEEGGLPAEGYLAIPLGSFAPRWKVEESFADAEVDREVRIPYAAIVSLVHQARASHEGFKSGKNGPPKDRILVLEPTDVPLQS